MTKSKLTFLVGGALMLGATMCQYSPNPKSGEMSCADTGKLCPDGFECSPVNGKCYRPEDMPQAPPSTGGTTTATTASTTGAGGATGGTTTIISSKSVVTGGQMGGAPSSPTSTTAAAGAVAGATIPITIIGGSIVSTTATGGGSLPLASIAGGAGGSPGGKPLTGGTVGAGAIAGVTAGGRPMGGASIRGGMTAITTAAGGSTISSTAIITPPSGATVTFSSGKAVGAMTGYGWVAMGSKDSVSDPTCGVDKTPITFTTPCASPKWSSPTALCMTGTIPALDATTPDYTGNWGIQLGINASDTTAGTLGQSFSSITIATSGSPSSGLRAVVHKKGDPEGTWYCTAIAGGALTFTSFTTTCYDTAKPGTALTAADVATIDRIGVQVSSSSTAVVVTNLCITGITFAK